jgi:hypothetical protein
LPSTTSSGVGDVGVWEGAELETKDKAYQVTDKNRITTLAPPGSSIHSGMRVASSLIFSLMLSRRRRSTALWLSRRRRRFSLAIIALGDALRHLFRMERETDDSLFGSCILCWVRSDILRTDATRTRCAVTAKGSCTKAVWCREGELLVPGAGRVDGEWGDGEARVGLAMRRYEDCMRMCTMPWRGGRAYAASLGTGGACGTTVGGGRIGGGGWTRARTGPSIGRVGARVVDGVMVCRWWRFACIVSKRGRKGGKTIVVVSGRMGRRSLVGAIVGIMERGRERRELGGKGELLVLLLVLLIGRVGC